MDTVRNAKFLVDLQPIGRRIEVDGETDLLTAAQKAGVDLVAACGGVGICGTCLVRLMSGELTPPTLTEQDLLSTAQLELGYRLACQAFPRSSVRLEIPLESLPSAQKMQIEGEESIVQIDPAVVALDVTLSPPNLYDLRSDLTRVNQKVTSAGFSPLQSELALLDTLSHRLREQGWMARLAIRPQEGCSHLTGVFAPATPLMGLAVDIGSTKLALYLIDLEGGATLACCGVMNPQIAYGEDVISRIAFANKAPENRKLLQERLIATLNETIGDLCRQAAVRHEQIVDAVFVGNTAMHHFFCGLPVTQLGASPYVPAVSEALEVRAAELGLKTSSGAWVYLPPNIAGYVGADHTSALLATLAMSKAEKAKVLVDIGTNTEISLITCERIYSCSTASGPAFEGAHIRDGMRAAAGAIENVHLRDGRVEVVTVGGQPPVGICGTGILKAISELRQAGVIDRRGTLKRGAPGVRLENDRAEFLLVPAALTGHGRDIVITRRDVNEIQLAKGAIRAGIEICLEVAGLAVEEVEEWVIAGAFGTYLDVNSALAIGMFPPQVPKERFRQVGNAAGMGAKRMLLSRQQRLFSNEIVQRVEYIELTVYPSFTQKFVEAMYLEGEEEQAE
ncbi:MAG: ASKHA domain-containing protein [Anaerolineales bacterium]